MKKETDETDDIDLQISDIGGVDDMDDLYMSLFDVLPEEDSTDGKTRYIKPKARAGSSDNTGIYRSAEDLAKKLKLWNGERYDCLVNGEFIFGDFVEAFLTTWNAKATEMLISTLSLNQENVDSLNTLMTHGYIDNLDVIVSAYFYSHEAYSLIPYIYKNLDIDDRFQLAVADIHTKICIFKSLGGKKVCIHGSANLRSCGAFEQFTIEENPELYDFYYDFHKSIVEKYATIKKNVRSKSLWDAVTTKTFREL